MALFHESLASVEEEERDNAAGCYRQEHLVAPSDNRPVIGGDGDVAPPEHGDAACVACWLSSPSPDEHRYR